MGLASAKRLREGLAHLQHEVSGLGNAHPTLNPTPATPHGPGLGLFCVSAAQQEMELPVLPSPMSALPAPGYGLRAAAGVGPDQAQQLPNWLSRSTRRQAAQSSAQPPLLLHGLVRILRWCIPYAFLSCVIAGLDSTIVSPLRSPHHHHSRLGISEWPFCPLAHCL